MDNSPPSLIWEMKPRKKATDASDKLIMAHLAACCELHSSRAQSPYFSCVYRRPHSFRSKQKKISWPRFRANYQKQKTINLEIIVIKENGLNFTSRVEGHKLFQLTAEIINILGKEYVLWINIS